MEQINEAGVRRKEKTPGTVTEPPPPKPSSLGGSKSSAPLTACTSPSLLARPSVLPVGVCPTSASLLSSNSAWPEVNSFARHAPRHHTHTHTHTRLLFLWGSVTRIAVSQLPKFEPPFESDAPPITRATRKGAPSLQPSVSPTSATGKRD